MYSVDFLARKQNEISDIVSKLLYYNVIRQLNAAFTKTAVAH